MIRIEITEAAVEHLESETHIDRETAREALETCISLCIREDNTKLLREELESLEKRLEASSPIRKAARELLEVSARYPVGFDVMKASQALDKALRETPETPARPHVETRLLLAARDLIAHLRRSGINGDIEELARIQTLEGALEEWGSRKIPEGEGSEDRLYKTARSLVDYFEEWGADRFEKRFGFSNIDIIETCRKIIEEGEGNPHPWD